VWDDWTPSPNLRQLLIGSTSTWTLPKWISPASLPHLAHLDIDLVRVVATEHIQILGTLPNLVELSLNADHQNYLEQPIQKFLVSADAFPLVGTRPEASNQRPAAFMLHLIQEGAGREATKPFGGVKHCQPLHTIIHV
jgi:hypothetical protein